MSFSLAHIPTPLLERFLERVRAGRAGFPLSESSLLANGLASLAPAVATLNTFGVEGSIALMEAVLSERLRVRPMPPELVWTGPEARVSSARDTEIVLAELFGSARQSVLVAGFRFDSGARLLAPLHRVMKEHRVECSVFGDATEVERFVSRNWPFGEPYPTLYRDVRTNARASLHAKCVVIDEERALVTSANFTDRGQTRNVEVGVLLHDATFARSLSAQWQSAVSALHFERVMQCR